MQGFFAHVKEDVKIINSDFALTCNKDANNNNEISMI